MVFSPQTLAYIINYRDSHRVADLLVELIIRIDGLRCKKHIVSEPLEPEALQRGQSADFALHSCAALCQKNPVFILAGEGKTRLSALFEPPPVLPLTLTVGGYDSPGAYKNAGATALVGSNPGVVSRLNAPCRVGDFRIFV